MMSAEDAAPKVVGSTPPTMDSDDNMYLPMRSQSGPQKASTPTLSSHNSKNYGMVNPTYPAVYSNAPASETYAGPVVLGSKTMGKGMVSTSASSPQVTYSQPKFTTQAVQTATMSQKWNLQNQTPQSRTPPMPTVWSMPEEGPSGDYVHYINNSYTTKPRSPIASPKQTLMVGGQSGNEIPASFLDEYDPNYRYFYKYYPVLMAAPREHEETKIYRAPPPPPPPSAPTYSWRKGLCGGWKAQPRYHSPPPRAIRVPDYYNAYEPLPASPRIRPTRRTENSFIDCVNNFLDSLCLQPPPPVKYYDPPPVAPTQSTGSWCLDKANEILDDWTAEPLPPPPPPQRERFYFAPCECAGGLLEGCMGGKQHRAGYCPECDHLRCHRCGRVTVPPPPPRRGILC